jgi:transaldolase
MSKLGIKIFADGADHASIVGLYESGEVDGFTTNPTLMRKAGITDYEMFAQDILRSVRDVPVSFEVFSDEFGDMERQARKIAAWADNVYVKVPITTTRGESSAELIHCLSSDGIKLNVTAILTPEQVCDVKQALHRVTPAIVSVFGGRIADTGVNPIPTMRQAKEILSARPLAELLWASCREVLNVKHAEEAGCDIITITPDLLKKVKLFGKSLTELSLETVKMFHQDAIAAGFQL